MKQLPDNLASLAVARALRICGRPDMVDIEFEEIGLTITVRSPTPAEFATYSATNDGPSRSAAEYCLLVDCLVYPCDAKGEPDIEALRLAVDELPAIVSEATNSIIDLAAPVPFQAVEISEAVMPRIIAAIGEEKLAKVREKHKRVKCMFIEDASCKALLIRAPSRASYEAAQDVTRETLVDVSNQLAIDCIVSIEDADKAALLKKYPALGFVMRPILLDMAGAGAWRDKPRKKARRVFSGS